MIKDNIEEILKEIEANEPSKGDVTLICVSKTKPLEMVKEAYDAGQRNFGENKVQEIVAKAPEMPSDAIWHMIGHLQKNKVKKAVQYASVIHSVDSLELAEVINNEAEKIGKVQDILLEINIASEESKYGIKPEEAVDLAIKVMTLSNIRLRGFMCVAPFTDNPEDNRKYFSKMKKILVDTRSRSIDNDIDMLSMGMSGDYQVAIQEGATHVRIGTSIFGARDYSI
jgi:pyridoxal phosphate enzyme (YggS family)